MKDLIDVDRIALARSLFDAFAAGDLRPWEARLAPGFTFSYPGLTDGWGPAAARAYNEPFLRAFSDWVTEVHAAAAQGDTVFLEMTVHATQTGSLETPQGPVPASGRRGAVKAVLVAEVRDGLLQREATYWNVLDLMAQIA